MPALQKSPSTIAKELQEEEVSPVVSALQCIPGVIINLVLWNFMYKALAENSEPGSDIFDLHPKMLDLEGDCKTEYKILHWTLMLSVATAGINYAMTIYALARGKGMSQSYTSIMMCCELPLLLPNLCISLYGMYFMVIGYDKDDIQDCPFLHTVCWWAYIGMLFISLIVGCCVGPAITLAYSVATYKEGGEVKTAQAREPRDNYVKMEES